MILPIEVEDANCTIELLMRSLKKASDLMHGFLPANLHVHADNTCAEVRNQQVAAWGAALIATSLFQSVTIGHFEVIWPIIMNEAILG